LCGWGYTATNYLLLFSNNRRKIQRFLNHE
jgi:hypothetical protein